MRAAFAYLFSQVRQLVDIPPELTGGDPSFTITVNLRHINQSHS